MSAAWRDMRADDIAGVSAVAARVHPDFPERDEVLAEKRSLFPAGCFTLEQDGAVVGYALSHPWSDGSVPKLDALIGTLPAAPSLFYIHDLALLPETRGAGLASLAAARLADVAAGTGLRRIGLVAVNGSVPFWTRQGYRIAQGPAGLADGYGETARYMLRDLA